MPLKKFICTDGVEYPTHKCIEHCRLGKRCASRAWLYKSAENREWTGTPSTTQLLNGPRQSYLELTTDYAESPDSRSYLIVGNVGHSKLDGADPESLTEQRMQDEINSGQFDNYCVDNGVGTLTDFKVYGAYKVRQVLDGKYENEQLQLNDYRLKLEAAGYKVHVMQLEMVVREGGGWYAKNKFQLGQNHYLMEIPKLPDEEVRKYFETKRSELMRALKGEKPRLCNAKESWNGRRCNGYCPVANACAQFGDNHYIKTPKVKLK